MAFSFQGKSVFLTGASSGIGAALARELAGRGARVALTARRAERLTALAEEIAGLGGAALPVPCDVTDRASLDAAVARTAAEWGGIDVVVANAGFGVSGPFDELDTAGFRRQFDTNFFGVVDTIYATLPHLKASRGRLGIVSSVLGRVGAPATAPYCASKFALAGLAESLHHDLARAGVAVRLINPGVVESEFRAVDNDGRYHADRPDPAPPWLRVPTHRAARAMANALEGNRFETTVTGHGRAIVTFSRHFPRLFRAVTRLANRGGPEEAHRRKRGQSDPS